MKEFSSSNIFIGQGVYFGDLIDGTHMKEYKRTSTRLFIELKDEKPWKGIYVDPTTAKHFLALVGEKSIKDYIPDIPETLTLKQIKKICSKLNGAWLDIQGKTTYKKAMEDRALEIEPMNY